MRALDRGDALVRPVRVGAAQVPHRAPRRGRAPRRRQRARAASAARRRGAGGGAEQRPRPAPAPGAVDVVGERDGERRAAAVADVRAGTRAAARRPPAARGRRAPPRPGSGRARRGPSRRAPPTATGARTRSRPGRRRRRRSRACRRRPAGAACAHPTRSTSRPAPRPPGRRCRRSGPSSAAGVGAGAEQRLDRLARLAGEARGGVDLDARPRSLVAEVAQPLEDPGLLLGAVDALLARAPAPAPPPAPPRRPRPGWPSIGAPSRPSAAIPCRRRIVAAICTMPAPAGTSPGRMPGPRAARMPSTPWWPE